MRKKVTDSLAGKVLQTKRAIAIGNDSQWKRTHTALLVKSLIYVPLVLQNKPIGVLGVTNHLKETSFDSNDTRALSALGGYATIAINNANIYSEIERDRKMLSAIVEKTADPILLLDENNVLVLINASGRTVFDLDDAPLTGQPVADLIKSQAALDFITQPETEALQMETELDCADGQRYKAELTLIEGGIRSVLLQALN
jgi:GAF domain-containing protein